VQDIAGNGVAVFSILGCCLADRLFGSFKVQVNDLIVFHKPLLSWVIKAFSLL
jgi:hypothetical protein